MKGLFHQAIPIYENNYKYYSFDKDNFRKINAGISLANAFIESQELELSFPILKQVTLQNDSVNSYPDKAINTLYAYETWAKYYSQKHDFALANTYEKKRATTLIEVSDAYRLRTTKLNEHLSSYAQQRANQTIQQEKEYAYPHVSPK